MNIYNTTQKQNKDPEAYLISGFSALKQPTRQKKYFKFSPLGVTCHARLVEVLGLREELNFQKDGTIKVLDFLIEVLAEGVNKKDGYKVHPLPEPVVMKATPRQYWCNDFDPVTQEVMKKMGWDGSVARQAEFFQKMSDEAVFEFKRTEIQYPNGRVGGFIDIKFLCHISEYGGDKTDIPF
tara:strand:- start:2593 stop:3135 length:543 start_codon:yes stop_codon:yes gene_type:complete